MIMEDMIMDTVAMMEDIVEDTVIIKEALRSHQNGQLKKIKW